jgi:phosphoribosylpyrophosphate synthetase
MRGKKSNGFVYNSIPYDFKKFGYRADEFCVLIQTLTKHLRLDFAIGIPSSQTGRNNIQEISDTKVSFVTLWSRGRKHKGTDNALENESSRVQIIPASHAVKDKSILLCDDIATSGETMFYYHRLLLNSGASKIVPFSIAHKFTVAESVCSVVLPSLLPHRSVNCALVA